MSENESTVPQADKISEAVGKLLENPSLLQNVASALGLGMSDGTKSDTDKSTEGGSAVPDIGDLSDAVAASASPDGMGDMMSAVLPLISKLSHGGGKCRHESLLCALKPYLSPSRREAVDYVLKISKMSDLVKGIGR